MYLSMYVCMYVCIDICMNVCFMHVLKHEVIDSNPMPNHEFIIEYYMIPLVL